MAGFVRWIKGFFRELRRRRVIRVAVVYAGTGFVILEAADILQPALRLPSWTVRFIVVLLALGFPLAVGLAWVYNVTEEGLVQADAEGKPGEIGPGGKPFTSNVIIVVLLIVAIGLLAYPRLFSSGEEAGVRVSAPDTAQIDERSIAVLPFEALSSGEKTETFARGVHDDLLTRLSNISDLKVISRTSVEKYRNTNLSLPAIADSLGVRWVMEGGVLESGGQIQVNAQLIDPENDAHVWADDYRRRLTAENLFSIQEEITDEIAGALKAEITSGEEKRIAESPTDNLQAYRFYVKGRTRLNSRTKEGIRSAINYFRSAIQQDSTYALAWAGLADARGLFSEYGLDSLHVSVPSQEEVARRALKLDPDLAEAHAAMGYVHLKQQNAPTALRHLKRSVHLKPSYAQAHHWLGYVQLAIGRPKRGLGHLRQAVELDPQHFAATATLVSAHLANGQSSEALAEVRRLRRIGPRPSAVGTEVLTLHHVGRVEEARKLGQEKLSEIDSSSGSSLLRLSLAMAEAAAGNRSRARRVFPRGANQGLLLAALGQPDGAFEAFRKVEEGEWSPRTVSALRLRSLYPDLLGPLRDDPRYEELIRQINRQWGLNPDGSVPEETDTSPEPQADA